MVSLIKRAVLLRSEKYMAQWHLHGRKTDKNNLQYFSVNAESAWESLQGFGSEDVVIGFADDGCFLSCIDENISSKFIAAAYLKNGIVYAGQPKVMQDKMYIPGYRHGSALAGLMAAPLSKVLPIGVAPGCRLLPVRWEYDDGFQITQKGFHQILKFLSDKVDVFVNTWARLPHMKFSEENVELIRELSSTGGRRGKGIVFVWAAGNSNCPINFKTDNEIPYYGYVNSHGQLSDARFSTCFTHSLAELDNVLLVSAVNCYGQKAHYSCYGPGISICAPSNNSHCFDAYLFNEPGLTTRSADSKKFTHNFKGTSASAALVAAVAGLVVSANANLNARDIVSLIKKTATKDMDFSCYPELSFNCNDTPSGYVLDTPISPFERGYFDTSGWSPWFGYGLVNAAKAVERAIML
ncbi:S8 family serine peptidase [Serratia sp. (in: enterobacteria)]|uniref:S8 family serine peptidase n=1 Tax=Serratia sp. (in: enterobacteria) TaxID=616 RepID=UPI003988D459